MISFLTEGPMAKKVTTLMDTVQMLMVSLSRNVTSFK